jgi:hypothetical protein
MNLTVKLLEWRDLSDQLAHADIYTVCYAWNQGPKDFVLSRGNRILGYYDMLCEAKSAAQIDHEARVRSFIVMEEPS